VAYAFMINDIEDAPDDAREEGRKARNPIATGELSVRAGWIASGVVALVTLLLYAAGGALTFITGALCLALSHLYSWKPVRLKAWPAADVISHVLMLCTLLFFAAYFAYDQSPSLPVWALAGAVSLVSAYGQLYNQLRDYNMDKAAGLRNTALTIGRERVELLVKACLALAVILFAYTVLAGLWPLWVAIFAVIAGAAVLLLFKPETDMRGGESAGTGGDIQIQFLMIGNIVMVVWTLVVALGINLPASL
jgi:4-hydroxybenzoate polyprenyltransferase